MSNHNTTDWNKVLEEILLENVWSSGDREQDEPCFGQYTPNLLFTDENAPEGAPDPHYYAAQGVEPPQAEGRQLAPIWAVLSLFVFVGVPVVAIWTFMEFVWPLITNCYIQVAGC